MYSLTMIRDIFGQLGAILLELGRFFNFSCVLAHEYLVKYFSDNFLKKNFIRPNVRSCGEICIASV